MKRPKNTILVFLSMVFLEHSQLIIKKKKEAAKMIKNKNILKYWIEHSLHYLYECLIVATFLVYSSEVFAFSQLSSGFTTLTRSYLLPLSGSVAGCSFI